MKLNVLKRNQPNQKIDLGKDVLATDYSETVFLIGRSKDCHVVLDDKQVSREHLRIIHKNAKWFAEKTSEESICLYNGADFTKVELLDGDSLTIASFTINIEDIPSSLNEYSPEAAREKTIPIQKAVIESPIQKLEFIETLEDSKATQLVDNNKTQELDSTHLTNEINISENATTEIELPSDFNSLNHSTEPKEDEFNYSDNAENEAEIALGLSEEGHEGVDENVNYSLENIDNDSEADSDSTKVMQSFAKVQLELFGESAPYDKYLIENEKTFIGRDPAKCQIVLNDSEVSTVHAVVTKNNIQLILEDLNSSNGTILNGDRINKAVLNHNDEFVIGGVTFTVKIRSDFLKEENLTLMPVDENQTVEVEEIVEVQTEEGETVDALGHLVTDAPQEKSIIKRIWKDDAKRKKAIYVIVGLVLAWVMFDDPKPPAPVKPKIVTPKPQEKVIVSKSTGRKLSDEEKRALSARYEIGKNHYYNGRYREALEEFQKIASVDSNFNSSLQSLIALSKEGLSKLEEQEKKRLAEQAAAEKKVKVKELLAKASEYVKDRRVALAQEIFNEIAKIDPENIEITKMKLELEDWQREKARKELEEVTKKKAREDKIEKLKPGKTLFLQKEWFKAAAKLDDFLKLKDMDEDLIKEASEMLKTARDEVSSAVSPLAGKAKSLMEGQDLKGAYEVYQQILKIEPSNTESLNQVGEIKEQLTNKARKIYREAIISESLSLFQDAKEKFQEVQQISPVDSDYYKKATDKLRDYLD